MRRECREFAKQVGLVGLGFGLACVLQMVRETNFGPAATPVATPATRRLKDQIIAAVPTSCPQAYLDLYATLGDKLCDRGIEPGNGAYCRDANHYRGADTGLVKGLEAFLKREGNPTVIDFGAGGGWYRDALTEAGLSVQAYDGAVGSKVKARTKKMQVGFQTNQHPFMSVTRLPLTFEFGDAVPSADWVYCIEVAEHVPKSFETPLINNIVTHARKGLIVTWAPPGQGGKGHINNQPRQYVINRFGPMGFVIDEVATKELADSAFDKLLKANVLVFRRVP